jgi:hypothetical protein
MEHIRSHGLHTHTAVCRTIAAAVANTALYDTEVLIEGNLYLLILVHSSPCWP